MNEEQNIHMERELQKCKDSDIIHPNDGAKPEGFRLGYEAALRFESYKKELRDKPKIDFEKWLSTFSKRNEMYDFTDSLSCCRNSMRDNYNNLGIGEY